MSPPLVSVVIPTYNRAHLISDALDSIIAQSYRPLEIIIVDDGSTDDTKSTVIGWQSGNMRPVALRYFEQTNLGGNVARNRGVTEACGEIVAFLDSDDTWAPAKLEKQVAVFQKSDRIGAVYCGVRIVSIESGSIIAIPNRPYPQGDILDQLLVRDVTAPTSAYLIRRQVFQEAEGFDENLRARQDWDMWIRVAAISQIGCVPEALVDLRDHAGPRTASNPQREIDAYHRILVKYRALRHSRGLVVQLAARSAYHRRMGRVSFHYQNKRGTALKHYARAIIIWPFTFDNYAALIGVVVPSFLRNKLRAGWNGVFGRTFLSIRSH